MDDIDTLGFLQRSELPREQRHPRGALAASREMEDELRQRFGDAQVDILRTLLIDFVERHGGGDELAARRSRASDPS